MSKIISKVAKRLEKAADKLSYLSPKPIPDNMISPAPYKKRTLKAPNKKVKITVSCPLSAIYEFVENTGSIIVDEKAFFASLSKPKAQAFLSEQFVTCFLEGNENPNLIDFSLAKIFGGMEDMDDVDNK
jgi:hypothetical protein